MAEAWRSMGSQEKEKYQVSSDNDHVRELSAEQKKKRACRIAKRQPGDVSPCMYLILQLSFLW